MGIGELGALLGTVAMLFLGLLVFVGKDALTDLKQLKARLADQGTEIAVMKASRLGERLERLEEAFGEIKGDVRHILSLLEEQRSHQHNRREGDQ